MVNKYYFQKIRKSLSSFFFEVLVFAIILPHSGAAVAPPVFKLIGKGVLSSFPNHIAVASLSLNPTNHASIFSEVVPVFPAAYPV
jgi:hypothetical protein